MVSLSQLGRQKTIVQELAILLAIRLARIALSLLQTTPRAIRLAPRIPSGDLVRCSGEDGKQY